MAETKSRCSRPWEDMSIIGIAGGSGSGKSSVAAEIIKSLNLPGAVILVMDHFYKSLTPEQNAIAHQDEYDFDSPDAIDFDVLVQTLQNLKQGLKVEIPIYSFTKHQREEATVSLYPPRVLILEGILAFTDPRIVDMLDIKARGALCHALIADSDLLWLRARSLWKRIWMSALGEGLRETFEKGAGHLKAYLNSGSSLLNRRTTGLWSPRGRFQT
ncbi:hypothetical protein D8B26_002371 [Coccidioides posadasii str. Silveira]|uniref:uncharacterized protein n=1 Tax=Coccidioides posadasii (strain RMSCC 757 / Silveira) TaxID=443226 RepID=UPI001BF06E49|nr:hypothetical protein D8B26_002371 [Coccidioides posadasii str. Silveira]